MGLPEAVKLTRGVVRIEEAITATVAEERRRRGDDSVEPTFEWSRWWYLTPPPDQVALRVRLDGRNAEVLLDRNYLIECANEVYRPEVKALIQQIASQLFMKLEAEEVSHPCAVGGGLGSV